MASRERLEKTGSKTPMGILRVPSAKDAGVDAAAPAPASAEAARGTATAAASKPPVVVMKFLRLAELGKDFRFMAFPPADLDCGVCGWIGIIGARQHYTHCG